MTLVSERKVAGKTLKISWADPACCDIVDRPKKPFRRTEWRQAMDVAIRASFEYWLGAKNLPGDEFLRRHIRMREDRFVPISIFTGFARLRVWCQDVIALQRSCAHLKALRFKASRCLAMLQSPW